jgi:peptidoglycan hydrolase-like protein with peptidoglycan-binding domain
MGGQAQNGAMEQSPQQIRQAQEQLKAQGLYNGRVDGKMGAETAQAISKFQQQNGLPQNSQLDQQTMAKLGGSGNGTTAGSGSSMAPATMNPSSPPSTSNPGAGSNTNIGSGGASTPSTTGTTTR